jgi:CheY-like chemotaxis protein
VDIPTVRARFGTGRPNGLIRPYRGHRGLSDEWDDGVAERGDAGMNAVAIDPRPIRVVIVDDTEDLRFLLRHALERAGMEVVGEAGDGRAGIEVVSETQPDVVLLDLAMPVLDGRAALPRICREAPDARVVVLSGFGADLMSEELLELGAFGYVEKGHSISRIVEFIEDVVSAPPRTRPPGTILRLVL